MQCLCHPAVGMAAASRRAMHGGRAQRHAQGEGVCGVFKGQRAGARRSLRMQCWLFRDIGVDAMRKKNGCESRTDETCEKAQ